MKGIRNKRISRNLKKAIKRACKLFLRNNDWTSVQNCHPWKEDDTNEECLNKYVLNNFMDRYVLGSLDQSFNKEWIKE